MPRDSAPPGLRVSAGAATAAGPKPVNQDFHGVLVPEGARLRVKGAVAALADGISSSPLSGQAAEIAVTSLLDDYYAAPDSWSTETAGRAVIGATNAWLHAQARARDILDMNLGPVTTLSALVLRGRTGHVFHVGDSRVWRLSGTSLEQLTTDHRAALAGGEDYLARALGLADRVEIDHLAVPLAEGDVFVLTTDGCHGRLNGRDVAQALRCPLGLEKSAEFLVQLALDRGADDNVTLALVRVEGLEAAEAPARLDTLPLPGPLEAGRVIDGLRLVRQVHAGDRSHVWLAMSAEGVPVALKLPADSVRDDAGFLARFALEDWVLRRVSSPHVLRPLAAAPASMLYIASEWIDGVTLRQWMTDNPHPPLDRVRDIAGQIALGLRALHRREMIHQDLRPENIMFDRDGTVRLIDLGSVAVAGLEEALPGLAGPLPGTHQYTAPEYLTGDPVDWRGDLFSLGVITYEMLTGRLPYGPAAGRVSSRAEARRLHYRPAHDDRGGLPDWVDAALARATHPDPLRRPAALSEFLAELRSPGPGYRPPARRPLIERDPLRFWQGLSLILSLVILALLGDIFRG